MKSWDRQLGRAFAMIKLSSANGLEVSIRPFLWPLVGVIAPDVWRGKTHEPEWMAGAVVRSVDEASLSRVGLCRPGGRSRGSQPGTAGARPASYLRLTAGGGP